MRAFLIAAALFLPLPAMAAVTVHDAWAPPSLIGSEVGVAYLTLDSADSDTLVSVDTPAAKSVEIHTHEKDGDIVRMRMLSSLPLAKGVRVVLAPRGLHLMLYGLKAPLKEGKHFPLTLRFAKARPVSVTVIVSQQKLDDSLK